MEITLEILSKQIDSLTKEVHGQSTRLEVLTERLAAFQDHERRIRELEGWKNRAIGVVAVVGIGVSILVNVISKAIGG